jgi:uncharacterized protein (AIM24 family)
MATSTRAPVNEEEFLGALYKGGELLAAGKIVEARSHLEKAHFLSPKNEKAQNLLGLTYFKLGLFDQASDIYEKLVNENPADPTLRVNLGLVYLKTNNLPRCIKEFETATDLDPDHKKAHNYLGLALAQAGDYAKAREHFVLAGSEQMAEKMARALSAKIESAPSSHGLVVPPAPPATATAVTAQPAQPTPHASPPRPPPVARQTIAVAVAPPLPPPAEDEIEVMSDDAELLDAEAETAAVDAPPPPPPEPAFEPPQELPAVDAAPAEVEFEAVAVETTPIEDPLEAAPPQPVEPMPEEIEIAPPAPSGPRLERDWGAQFGMDAEAPPEEQPVIEGTMEELPVVEAIAEAEPLPAQSQRAWATPLVNSWDAASGMSPPAAGAAPESSPDASDGPSTNEGLTVTQELPSDDDAWNAARRSAVVEAPPPAETAWNVPPDPAQEMDFGDVAPTDTAAAPADPGWSAPPEAPPAADDPRWSQPQDASPAESWSEPQELPPVDPAAPTESWSEPQDLPPVEAAAPAESWEASPELPQADAPSTESWDAPPELPQVDAPSDGSWDEAGQAEAPAPEAWSEPQELPAPAESSSGAPETSAEAASWESAPADAWASPQDGTATDAGPPQESWAQPQELPPAPSETWSTGEPPADEATWTEQPQGTEPSPEAAWAAPVESTPAPAWNTSPSAPRPPASAPTPGYAPMEARTLVELGASTSTIEEPAAGPFHVGPHGLAITVSGEMLTRMTNLVAIVGSVQAKPERKRARGRAIEASFGEGADQMQRLVGHGVVHLEMGGARFHALDLDDNDGAYLREERVFGFEESIGFEHGRLSDDEGKLALDLVHLSGDGRVLLQLNGAMKSLAVPPGAPMVVPLQRLVGWFGRVSPRLTGFAGQGAVELTGDGYALLVTPG